MSRTLKILKDWSLILAIVAGVAAYFIYVNIPALANTRQLASDVVAVVQPLLIFSMLTITFCRVDLTDLRFRRWHVWHLLIQGGIFGLLGILLILLPDFDYRVEIEGAMLCLICPTATAAAVITRKLGGNVASVTTYTILINMLTALLIPVMVPFVHPHPTLTVLSSGLLIMSKVMPLLLLPLVAAMVMKKVLPRVHDSLARRQELSFYLWLVALALAIAVTTRSIVHTTVPVSTQVALVVISLACCLLQFYIGRRIGIRYGETVTAQQSLGQKNTVVAIWMGYTFFSPVTAMVGGFYSVWHNLVNSWQLYRQSKVGASKVE